MENLSILLISVLLLLVFNIHCVNMFLFPCNTFLGIVIQNTNVSGNCNKKTSSNGKREMSYNFLTWSNFQERSSSEGKS